MKKQQTVAPRRRAQADPERLAHRIVGEYFARTQATIHDIVEVLPEQFGVLLEALHGGTEAGRLRDCVAIEEKLRAALPESLHPELIQWSDLHGADLNDYLEAGYLIGFAVASRTSKGGAR